MSVKSAPINVMVQPEVKKKLLEKAKNLNLSLTNYIEKIALEPIIFMDSNAKTLLRTLELK